jgi:methionyl-tRNA formyltransferase
VNVVLIGGKHFGCLALHLLASKSNVVIQRVVVTEEDDRLGKLSKKLNYELCVSNPKLVDADAIPDTCDLIVAAYTHARVSDAALLKSKLGGIGYHPSLLPRHRGKHAVEDTISCKDLIAGGSVYQLSQEWDQGNILIQDWCKVQSDDNAGTLWRRDLSPMGIRLLSTAINDIINNGYIISKPQE